MLMATKLFTAPGDGQEVDRRSIGCLQILNKMPKNRELTIIVDIDSK